MCFEDAYNPYWPYFVSMTYEKEPQDRIKENTRKDIQSFIKSIRDKGYHVRYFAVVERGSKKGRVHCHAILWSDANSRLGYHSLRAMLQKSWKKGFVLLKRLYGGKGGFIYATKYIQKEIIYYTWSRRPGLGGIARDEFIEKAVDRYYRTGKVIERMRIPILGEFKEIRVNSGWMRKLKKVLGLRKRPEIGDYVLNIEKPTEEQYINIMKQLLKPSSSSLAGAKRLKNS
jgi:hypothetical protein